jgi:hypothetical protein
VTNNNYGFWLYGGKNGLQGAPSTVVTLPDGRPLTQKDPDNPAVLQEEFIAFSLRTSRQARHDFCRLFPSLDAESQARLSDLILQNPRATSLLRDDQDFHDAIQHKGVTEGVRSKFKTRVKQIASEGHIGLTGPGGRRNGR